MRPSKPPGAPPVLNATRRRICADRASVEDRHIPESSDCLTETRRIGEGWHGGACTRCCANDRESILGDLCETEEPLVEVTPNKSLELQSCRRNWSRVRGGESTNDAVPRCDYQASPSCSSSEVEGPTACGDAARWKGTEITQPAAQDAAVGSEAAVRNNVYGRGGQCPRRESLRRSSRSRHTAMRA